MRRRRGELPRSIFRPNEVPRLSSMLVMLAIVGLIVYSARNHWRGPADPAASIEEKARASSGKQEPEAAAKPAPKPVPTGPTDEDREQQEAIREERQVIEDDEIYMSPHEMHAYWRVVEWARNQPVELLSQRAKKDTVYDDFFANPEDMRFRLVEFDLNIRQVLPKKIEGKPQVYQLFGSSTQAQGWPFFIIVPELPPGMATGTVVQERARVAGYFFKIQGYQTTRSELKRAEGGKGTKDEKGAKEKAPVIIGKLIWEPPPPQAEPVSIPWQWAVGGLVVLGAAMFGIIWVVQWRRPGAKISLGSSALGTQPVDEWLDDAQSGRGDVFLGNNPVGNGESSNGHADIELRGPGNGKPPAFPGDLDAIGR